MRELRGLVLGLEDGMPTAREMHTDRLGCAEGTMAKGIKHYSRKVRRYAIDGTRTRHIVVEEHPEGVLLIVYEVKPTKERYGSTVGYEFHPVLRKWYLTLKEGLSAAETVFDSNLNLGFREVVADTSAEG
jgi:hypothetical protein